jgi:phosphoglycerate dehydrogenase-like enzyme
MKIVLHPSVDEDLRQQVQDTAPDAEVVMANRDNAVEAVAGAEIIFGAFTPEMVRAAPNLKWIQSTSAGMDKALTPQIADSDIIICNASGVHAVQVAEHAWALTTALTRGLHISFRHQLDHAWKRPPLSDLLGATILIVGFGGVGQYYARLAQGYEARLIALDIQGGNKPDYVEAIWDMDRLDEGLQMADVVFIAVPFTPETDKLINARTLGLMKNTAFLVNTARGPIVDQAAVIEALKTGEIAGAGLDVFETEPLSPDSPLWDLENAIVTPHAAGGSPNRHNRTIAFFCQNLKRYMAGEPLFNEVDKTLGYPKRERRVN